MSSPVSLGTVCEDNLYIIEQYILQVLLCPGVGKARFNRRHASLTFPCLRFHGDNGSESPEEINGNMSHMCVLSISSTELNLPEGPGGYIKHF